MELPPFLSQISWGLVPLYAAGVFTAVDAVMKARTPQGATAWVFALVAFPLVALPLYWVVGRFKFDDYLETLRAFDVEELDRACKRPLRDYFVRHDGGEPEGEEIDGRSAGEMEAFTTMATLPFTCGNGGRLLVDGDETFDALFAGIDAAERYVLAQFYIIHDDRIGTAFKDRLVAAARRGVSVRLLYDAVGSWKLPRAYRRELEEAGVTVRTFTGPRNWLKKLRLNFRNHRKIVVVDGAVAFVGGLNVGDEYLGRDSDLSPWRDTHLAVRGPVVQGLQLSFVRDWTYAARERIDGELAWEPTPCDDDWAGLVLASGPADPLETCGLLYAHAIESAERRVWIATPYFIPDGRILGALQLAALRGVDVRIVMPRQTDSVFFKYAPYAFLPDVTRAGVKVYLYEPGFMHQKVALVDGEFGILSTANLDNRSFRLNFEATVVFRNETFCGHVESMLAADFERCTELRPEDLSEKSFAFRFAANATRLLAPVL